MTITAPTDISGCITWLDAADAGVFTFSSGSDISHWTDKSSRAIDFATDSGTPQRQTNVLNGKAVVNSNGGGRLRGITVDTAQPQTCAWVVRTNSSGAGANRVIADGRGGGTAGWEFGLQTGPDRLYTDAGTSRIYYSSWTDDVWHYVVAVMDGSNSIIRVDGSTVSGPGTNIGSNGIDDDLFILKSRFGGDPMDGSLAEVVYYDSSIGSTNYTDLEAYFVAKWFAAAQDPDVPLLHNVQTLPNYRM